MPEPEVKETDDQDELKLALDASTAKEGGSEGKTAEELAAEEEAKKKAAEETVTVKKVDYERDQKSLKELRALTLTQKREQATMQATLGRLQRNQETLSKAQIMTPGKEGEDELELGEEDEAGGKKRTIELEAPTEVEKLEEQLKDLGERNSAQYEMLLDMMEDTEKYKDVHEVCSDTHFRDIVHAVATQMSKEQGVDYNEAALQTEIHIWSQRNPYKYMYSMIKEYHPDYASEEDLSGKDKGGGKGGGKEGADAGGKPPKTPKSIASVEGSHDTSTGWTAKKIDELPEDELEKVPPEIYEKYMAGELD